MQHNGRDIRTFTNTKEHRRFVEFANAVRKPRYIGLCCGRAGVGKTLSARRYAHWDSVEPYLDEWPHDHPCTSEVVDTLVRTRTLFYTPSVSETIRDMRESLGALIYRAEYTIDERLNYDEKFCKIAKHNNSIEMILFDESERLSMNTTEFIRSIFDKKNIGVLLIGMPSMEKRFARFAQFYSRVGFAHNYRPLTGDELTFVLTRHWRSLGINLDNADFTDVQAVATIARITGGNFRLLHRLFTQIERIMQINELTVITDDVAEAARSTLVIGVTKRPKTVPFTDQGHTERSHPAVPLRRGRSLAGLAELKPSGSTRKSLSHDDGMATIRSP